MAAALVEAADKPNIVLVLCDDLGYGDVRAFYPEAKMATPRMDALAMEGMRFTDAHSPSSVCTPTRYGLLTGRYCWRTELKKGVLGGYSPSLLEPGRETIASMLKKQGYRTGGFGKWHLGLGTAEKTDYSQPLSPGPLEHGFDEYFGIPASLDMPPYVFIDGRRAQEHHPRFACCMYVFCRSQVVTQCASPPCYHLQALCACKQIRLRQYDLPFSCS